MPRFRDVSGTIDDMATTPSPAPAPAAPASSPVSLPTNEIRIGYARVSTRGQDHQAQLDALAGAHCRDVVVETASTRGDRPKLRATLDQLRAGDTLVIYKPDRVARSMKELLVFLEDELHARGITLEILTGVCAGVHRPDGATIADRLLFAVAALAAELERELIRERTLDGLRAAAAAGRRGGRPARVDDDVLAIAHARQARGQSVTVIARDLGIGRSTLYRALQPAEQADGD
jgi:DNA invertase Pin-like site-specific DNA recombinase